MYIYIYIYIHISDAVSSRNFDLRNFESRVSNPGTVALLDRSAPFKTSKFPGIVSSLLVLLLSSSLLLYMFHYYHHYCY